MSSYATIANKILGAVDGALGGQSAVVGAMTPIVVAGLTIWIMWFGWNTARGAGGSYIVSDLIATMARVSIVLSIGLLGGAYGANIASALSGAAAEFASFMGVKVTGNLYATLDSMQAKTNELTAKIDMIVSALQFYQIGLIMSLGLLNFVIGILLTLYTILAACVMLGMDASLKIIILLGPIFVACLAFPKTESFFYPWFNTAVATALGIATLMLPLTITQALFQGWIDQLSALGGTEKIGMMSVALDALGAVGISFYLLMKMPQLISGIIGSSVGGGAGIAQSIKSAIGSAASTTATATGGLAGAALANAKPGGLANRAGNAVGKGLEATGSTQYSNSFLRNLQRQGGNSGNLDKTPTPENPNGANS